jgi:hypothetical protein
MDNHSPTYDLLHVNALRCVAGEEFYLSNAMHYFSMFECDGKAYDDIGILVEERKLEIKKSVHSIFDGDFVVPDKDIYCFSMTDCSEATNGESTLAYVFDGSSQFEVMSNWLPMIAGLAKKLLDEVNDSTPMRRDVEHEYSFVLVFKIGYQPEYGEYGSIEYYEPFEELMGVLDTSNPPIRMAV